MKRYIHLILLGALLLSCHRESSAPESCAAGEECVVSLTVGREPVTKSILPAGIENRLDNAFVLILSQDGYSRYQYFDFTSASQPNTVDWRLPAGRAYTVYAVGNMGNILNSLPRTETGYDMASFRYEIPAYAGLTAMPMAKTAVFSASQFTDGANIQLSIALERLMAKVVVRVNKSGITSGQAAQALQSASLHLRQVAKALYPFRADGSMALSEADVFSGSTDYYVFPSGEAWNMDSGDITLYVPENRQGTGVTGVSQADKQPASGRAALCTYLEYTAGKDGSSDGVLADQMTYRAYLGEDESEDFNVIRDRIYSATLSLSWNGMWEGAWRVTTSSFSDTRTLVISASENSSTAIINTADDAVRVRKTSPTAFYLNYFVNGSSSPAHGRKDLADWPYGWEVYLDGVKTSMAGTSGTIVTGTTNLFTWTYNSTNDLLSVQAAPKCPSESLHSLQLKTIDGRKESNLVYFTSTVPYDYGWEGDIAPNHVAQTNTLKALDADTHEIDETGAFLVRDGFNELISLVDHNNGTATVSLLKPFANVEDAIRIIERGTVDDRQCNVPAEARLPHFACTDLGTAYIDASQKLTYTYFASDENGNKVAASPMTVVNTATAAGLNLSQALVEQLIAPAGSSTANKLGFEYNLNDSGSYDLFVYIATYEGLMTGTGATFNVDNASIFINNYKEQRGTHSTGFIAYNPWKLYGSGYTPVAGPVLKDYTLYRVPARAAGDNVLPGWTANPSDAPIDATSKNVDVYNVVISNERNLRFDAKFNNNAGYISEKIATGTPGIVSPDYTDSYTYQLRVHITDAANFDWKKLGDYLWYEQGHYMTGGVWDNPTATDAIKKQALLDFFGEASGWLAISAYCQNEVDAWNEAPSGVDASHPTYLQGVEFYLDTKSISSTWTLNYTMNGLTASDMNCHSAGKIDVVLKIVNPYDKDGATLDKIVSDAYMQLHLWVWASVGDVQQMTPGYVTSNVGWAYTASPYVFTDGKPVDAITTLFQSNLLESAAETYTNASTTYYRGEAANMSFSGDYYGYKGAAAWQFRDDDLFDNAGSDAEKRHVLMNVLSTIHSGSVFTFRTANDKSVYYPNLYGTGSDGIINLEGLNSTLGSDTFYRPDAMTLYYAPSTDYKTSENPTDKLFVLHIGNSALSTSQYFFDPQLGF